MKSFNYFLSVLICLMFTGCGGCGGNSNNKLGISISGASGAGLSSAVSSKSIANSVAINSAGDGTNNFFVLYPDGKVEGTAYTYEHNGQTMNAQVLITEVHSTTGGLFIGANTSGGGGWFFVSNIDEEVQIGTNEDSLSYIYSVGTKIYLMKNIVNGVVTTTMNIWEWDSTVRVLKEVKSDISITGGLVTTTPYFISVCPIGPNAAVDISGNCTIYNITTGQSLAVAAGQGVQFIAPVSSTKGYVGHQLVDLTTGALTDITYNGSVVTKDYVSQLGGATGTGFNSAVFSITPDGLIVADYFQSNQAVLYKAKADGTMVQLSSTVFNAIQPGGSTGMTAAVSANANWIVVTGTTGIAYLPSTVSVASIEADEVVRTNALTDPVTVLSGTTIVGSQLNGDLFYYSGTDASNNAVTGSYNLATSTNTTFNAGVTLKQMAVIQ